MARPSVHTPCQQIGEHLDRRQHAGWPSTSGCSDFADPDQCKQQTLRPGAWKGVGWSADCPHQAPGSAAATQQRQQCQTDSVLNLCQTRGASEGQGKQESMLYPGSPGALTPPLHIRAQGPATPASSWAFQNGPGLGAPFRPWPAQRAAHFPPSSVAAYQAAYQQLPGGLPGACQAAYQAAGCCWVMQWMLPALSRISRDFTPTTCPRRARTHCQEAALIPARRRTKQAHSPRTPRASQPGLAHPCDRTRSLERAVPPRAQTASAAGVHWARARALRSGP